MRILPGIAFSLIAASPALAQSERVVISAGEHDNYSRIAFHQSHKVCFVTEESL